MQQKQAWLSSSHNACREFLLFLTCGFLHNDIFSSWTWIVQIAGWLACKASPMNFQWILFRDFKLFMMYFLCKEILTFLALKYPASCPNLFFSTQKMYNGTKLTLNWDGCACFEQTTFVHYVAVYQNQILCHQFMLSTGILLLLWFPGASVWPVLLVILCFLVLPVNPVEFCLMQR